MKYIDKQTNHYPLNEMQIRALYPNTSFPPNTFQPPEDRFAPVFAKPKPSYNQITQTVTEGQPILTPLGHYEENWIVEQLSEEVVKINTEKHIKETREKIASIRYDKEVSGVVWNGFGISTDRESQSKIMAEDMAVNSGLRVEDRGWKCLDTKTNVVVFRPTKNTEIKSIANSVYSYVSSCFAREEQLLNELENGTLVVSSIFEGWPNNVFVG